VLRKPSPCFSKLLSEGQCQVLRTKAAGSDEGKARALTNGPQTINHPAGDGRANECPDKDAEPPAVIQVVTANEADHDASYSRDY
jgi:hypothetical protein